ncbi:MAG: hypothetical protein AABX69_03245 [Nanoarchaeota archaeon]
MDKKIVSLTLLVILAVAMVSAALFFATEQTGEQKQLKKFNSYEELEDFLKTNRERTSYGYGGVIGRKQK